MINAKNEARLAFFFLVGTGACSFDRLGPQHMRRATFHRPKVDVAHLSGTELRYTIASRRAVSVLVQCSLIQDPDARRAD
jgi:hypothetical protein